MVWSILKTGMANVGIPSKSKENGVECPKLSSFRVPFKMPANPRKAQELRNLAETLVRSFEKDPEFQEVHTEGLVTSLVRQWMTYDGHAALIIKNVLCFLPLTRTPLGAFAFKMVSEKSNWPEILQRDWHMAPEDIPEMIEQFNRGQSAEGTNLDGQGIRWWVNPGEKHCGVEGQPIKRDPAASNMAKLRVIMETLESTFSGVVFEHELPILAQSVANQWDKFGGYAAIMTEKEKVYMRMKRRPDGTIHLQSREEKFSIRDQLEELGLPPGDVIDANARLNLGQIFPFVGPDGKPCEIWQEPHMERVTVRTVRDPKREFGDPFMCRSCGGVLGLWKPSDTQQKCNLCGHICQRG